MAEDPPDKPYRVLVEKWDDTVILTAKGKEAIS
jgi:hypothetical protein